MTNEDLAGYAYSALAISLVGTTVYWCLNNMGTKKPEPPKGKASAGAARKKEAMSFATMGRLDRNPQFVPHKR